MHPREVLAEDTDRSGRHCQVLFVRSSVHPFIVDCQRIVIIFINAITIFPTFAKKY